MDTMECIAAAFLLGAILLSLIVILCCFVEEHNEKIKFRKIRLSKYRRDNAWMEWTTFRTHEDGEESILCPMCYEVETDPKNYCRYCGTRLKFK